MSDSVQQIKDKLNIIDVVSSYVELHKAGKNFKGKSPFAAEKTPSFYVSPDRGMYYCFSTSQGGDIFNFIQAMEGVDFKEALKILADKAGVELVPEDPKKKSERDRLHAVIEEAVNFYQSELKSETEALQYLEQRKIQPETIAKWRIGFAPGPPKGGWRELKQHLEAKGFTRDELLKAGLIKMANGGKEPFDVFRDRVVFPMAESNGKVVAFSGRILHPDEKSPKYVNSPETTLYKKSELLFGYDKAKTGIRTLDFSLIVEGQFDVVMCHQAGYGNTVAVSGTALTIHHVRMLERLSNKVVLALDADRAGIAAMKKAANVMLKRGLDVKVAEMSLGKDPADMIGEDPVGFKQTIGKSVHVIEFLLHVLRRENSDDRAFKLKAREEVLPFILLLPNRIDQEHFVGKVAESIGSTTEAVRYEIELLRERENKKAEDAVPLQPVVDDRDGIDRQTSSDTAHKLYRYLLAAVELVESGLGVKIRGELSKMEEIGELILPTEPERAETIFILEQQFSEMPALAVTEDVVSKLNQLKTSLVRNRLSKCRVALREAGSDDNKVEEALVSIKSYETMLREPSYTVEMFSK